MADNIFEMTRSLGQTRYTRFDETHDNENPVDQISETAAIGDAEGSRTEDSEACVKLLSVAEVAERRQIPSIRIGRRGSTPARSKRRSAAQAGQGRRSVMEATAQAHAPHETGQAASESSRAGEPTSSRRSETAMTNNKHATPQIPMKDFYTVQDVAILLGT